MRPNPRELFGTLDIIEEMKWKFSKVMEGVKSLDGFKPDADYVEDFSVAFPQLGKSRLEDRGETNVPAGAEAWSRNLDSRDLIKGRAFRLRIPFEGEGSVFKHMPSRSNFSGRQEGRVEDNEVVVDFAVPSHYSDEEQAEKVKENVRKKRNEIEGRINTWTGYAEEDFEAWNSNLEKYVGEHIASRKKEIEGEMKLKDAIDELTTE